MEITQDIKSILKLGYIMAREKNFMRLYEQLLESCVEMTDADGGSIYISAKSENGDKRLFHMTDYNRRLQYHFRPGSGGDADMAPDSANNLFSLTYHDPKIRHFSDIYLASEFDQTAIREQDDRMGIRTQSVLMVPICVEEKEVLGVMMLYNHRDAHDTVTPFPDTLRPLVSSLSTQMANTMESMSLIEDLEELLESFVHSLTTAIDAKTPYNANHTRHVREYCGRMVDYINAAHTRGETELVVSEADKDQLLMAALLHDIGKLIVPGEILNKSTRLGSGGINRVRDRLERIRLLLKIDALEGRLDHATYAMEDLRIANFLFNLDTLNVKERLGEEDLVRVEEIGDRVYTGVDGSQIRYLTQDEKNKLSIRRGTLTSEEKDIVHEHVTYTDKILADIRFIDKYDKVRRIAASHHEYLDGSGYPKRLTGEDLDILCRIITVCDIFDSLTADDRPYKRATPFAGAVKVLRDMVGEGKLDGEIVEILAKNMGPAE